jgi:Flp pilus assembly protein TadG
MTSASALALSNRRTDRQTDTVKLEHSQCAQKFCSTEHVSNRRAAKQLQTEQQQRVAKHNKRRNSSSARKETKTWISKLDISFE